MSRKDCGFTPRVAQVQGSLKLCADPFQGTRPGIPISGEVVRLTSECARRESNSRPSA